MHDLKDAQPSSPAGLQLRDSRDNREPDGVRARGGRRRRSEIPMPPIERKRIAALDLRKAYGRIKADFSEAYEQCRNDAQRRALERAHQAAREVYMRAIDERLFEDREVWKSAQNAFWPERSRAERQLAHLVAAVAVTRILKRLAAIDAALAVLAD